jgi:ABC-type antimicrobial peptide transport system permease subunit
MALGADRSDVRWLVMRHVGVVVAIGLVAGFGGALALTQLIARKLWGVTPTDLITFIGVSLIMALVGLLAGWIPTRRALEVAPTVALRAE